MYRYIYVYIYIYICIASFTGTVQCSASQAQVWKRERGWEMDGMNDTNDPTYPVERYCMIL